MRILSPEETDILYNYISAVVASPHLLHDVQHPVQPAVLPRGILGKLLLIE